MFSWLIVPLLAPLGDVTPEPLQADIAWVARGDFCEPETVLPLPDETLLVSNVCGLYDVGKGYLSLLDRNGQPIDWRIVDGLDAPLGMALKQGQLYIVDNNTVKVFRWPGYVPIRTIALEAGLANDIAVSDDDILYVTDSSHQKVQIVTPTLEQRALGWTGDFGRANGIHVNGDDLYVGGERLWHVDLRTGDVTTIGPSWLTDIDGIEQEADGTLQVTPVGGPLVRLGEKLEIIGGEGTSSANHAYSDKLKLAFIPTGFDNTVVAIRVPGNYQKRPFPGYQWLNVADGVFLHQPVDTLAGPVDGNSVIIDHGDGVVVIDTHINPAAARAAVQKINEVIGKPVTTVVNTHWHDDHANGNYVYRDAFPDARIVAHRETLAALRDNWEDMENGRRQGYASVDPDELLARADELEEPFRAWNFRVYAGYVAALKPELDALELEFPDMVFDDRFVIGGERRIELRWLGPGNTKGDIVAWLPGDKILVTGDLLVAPVPFAFDSPMADWVTTLDRLAKFDADMIIPGHGPVQWDMRYLEQLTDLLKATLERVEAAHAAGTGYEALSETVDLDDFRRQFTGGDPERDHAWQAFFVAPGLKSAWTSLGYELPPEP